MLYRAKTRGFFPRKTIGSIKSFTLIENNFRFFKTAKFEFKVTVLAHGQNTSSCDLLTSINSILQYITQELSFMSSWCRKGGYILPMCARSHISRCRFNKMIQEHTCLQDHKHFSMLRQILVKYLLAEIFHPSYGLRNSKLQFQWVNINLTTIFCLVDA